MVKVAATGSAGGGSEGWEAEAGSAAAAAGGLGGSADGRAAAVGWGDLRWAYGVLLSKRKRSKRNAARGNGTHSCGTNSEQEETEPTPPGRNPPTPACGEHQAFDWDPKSYKAYIPWLGETNHPDTEEE
jgi:hypothetical protein